MSEGEKEENTNTEKPIEEKTEEELFEEAKNKPEPKFIIQLRDFMNDAFLEEMYVEQTRSLQQEIKIFKEYIEVIERHDLLIKEKIDELHKKIKRNIDIINNNKIIKERKTK